MDFIKAIFSEDSKASFGRIGAFIALVASVGWVSWVVWKTNVIPDLGGVCLFIATLYGLSKGISAYSAAKGGTNAPTA